MSAKKHHSLWKFGGAFLALVAVAVIWMIQDAEKTGHADDPAQADSKLRPRNDTARDVATTPSSSTNESSPAEPAETQDDSPSSDSGIAKLSPRQASTVREGNKRVIDPMASWTESPPWPEGPKLTADVETSTARYINLRPNEMGLMPSLNVKPEDEIEVSLSLPESKPGETIYLELPNGGEFPGESLRGMTLEVGRERSVSFHFTASALRGHCTVHIRQAGHTRTLPLWVGEPNPVVPREDPSDPNVPSL